MNKFYIDHLQFFNQLNIDTMFDDKEYIITGDEWVDFRIWQNYYENQLWIWECKNHEDVYSYE